MEFKTKSCATNLVCRTCDRTCDLNDGYYRCCGATLDVEYDYEKAADSLSRRPYPLPAYNVWDFEELLPIRSKEAQMTVGEFAGNTPLIRAERLGDELGLINLFIKDDSTQRPSLSYKDRVVSMAIARLIELGKTEVACVSTGNVGTAVASLAAKAGIKAHIFYPGNMEAGKARACKALGANVIQLDGNYDQANAICKEFAEATGIEFVNITLRPFYSEGAKTVSFEIFRSFMHSPDHLVVPAAGGTLSSKMHKGLLELEAVGMGATSRTEIHIAQPQGCSPIASAVMRDDGELFPQTPLTKAHSLAIGNPGDGLLAMEAATSRGGFAATASDEEIFEAIDLLGRTEGILTEPAGGTTIAATKKLAEGGFFDPYATVVAVISGNGYKTLDEHPEKDWTKGVACDIQSMRKAL